MTLMDDLVFRGIDACDRRANDLAVWAAVVNEEIIRGGGITCSCNSGGKERTRTWGQRGICNPNTSKYHSKCISPVDQEQCCVMSPQFGRVKLYAAGIDLTGRKRCNAICSVIRPSKDGVGKADISASVNGDRKTLDSRDTCSQRVCGEKRRRAY